MTERRVALTVDLDCDRCAGDGRLRSRDGLLGPCTCVQPEDAGRDALCGALADLAQHVDEATDRELADALDGTLLDHVPVDVRPLLVSVIERLRRS